MSMPYKTHIGLVISLDTNSNASSSPPEAMTPAAGDHVHHTPYFYSSYPPHAFDTTTSGFHASQPTTNSQAPHLAILRRLILLVVVLFVIVCVFSSIAWFYFHPSLPLITLNSFTISNFTGFKSHLISDGDIELTVRNPNKKVNICLESFEVKVLYKENVLSRTSIEDLRLEKKSTEKVSMANLGFKGRDDISGCEKVLGDSGCNMRNGSVILNVKMFISAKFTAGGWFTRRKAISVLCKKVELFAAYNGTGNLRHGGKQCLVDISY